MHLLFVSFKALVSKCITEEAWELEYNTFHELKSFKNSETDGYLFKLNLLIFGQKEVHILLSATEKPNIEKESAYEIGKGKVDVIFFDYSNILIENFIKKKSDFI